MSEREGMKSRRKVLLKTFQGIPKDTIKRLARRGGVKRISGLIYEATKTVIEDFLTNKMKDMVSGQREKDKQAKIKNGKKQTGHQKYVNMASSAIINLNERNGSSQKAIRKYIMSNFNVGNDKDAVKNQLKLALIHAVTMNKVKHTKGQGTTGFFKLAQQTARKSTGPHPFTKEQRMEMCYFAQRAATKMQQEEEQEKEEK